MKHLRELGLQRPSWAGQRVAVPAVALQVILSVPISVGAQPLEAPSRGPFCEAPRALAQHAGSSSVYLYSSQARSYFRSRDDGQSWSRTTGHPKLNLRSYGTVLAVDPIDPDVVYGLQWNGTPSLSRDGGDTWNDLVGPPNDELTGLVASSSEEGVVYGLGFGLYKSEDFGDSWREITPPQIGGLSVLRVHPNDSSVLWAADQVTLARSIDGGETWSIGDNPTGSTLALDPNDLERAYGVNWDLFLATDDGGATWTTTQPFSSVDFFQGTSVLVDAEDPSTLYVGRAYGYDPLATGLYRSQDGGKSFSAHALEGEDVLTLQASARDSTIVLATTESGLFRSSTNTAAWQRISDLPLSEASEIAVSPVDPDLVFASLFCDDGRVARSDDGGDTWFVSGPLSDAPLSGDLSVARNGVVWLGGDAHVSKSTDGGHTWSDHGPSGLESYNRATSILPHPDSPSRILVVFEEAGVYRSENGGSTWVRLTDDPFLSIASSLALDPSDSSHVVAGIYGGLAESLDFGTTWSRRTVTDQDRSITQVVISERDPQVWWALEQRYPEQRVLRSNDGGANWSVLDTGEVEVGEFSRIATDPNNADIAWLTTPFDLARTTDGGTTWKLAYGDVLAEVETNQEGDVFVAAGRRGVARIPAMSETCESDAQTLCLEDGRFRITLDYETALGGGRSGSASVVSLGEVGIARGGILSFFSTSNPEVLVKVLDGCSVNDRFWVFFAATTTVGFTLQVEDLQAGLARVYSNEDKTVARTVTDTAAFDSCGTARRRPSSELSDAVPRAGLSGVALEAGGCQTTSTTLCIDHEPGDARFQVTADFETPREGGLMGAARATSLASLGIGRGGVLSFFSQSNPEILVKVLDGCAINDRFWVYSAATTDLGFVLRVEDTRTGETYEVRNLDGEAASPVAATAALDSCLE